MMRIYLPTLLILAALLSSCGPRTASPEEASKYNNAIVSHGDTVLHAFDAFNIAVESRDSENAKKRLELAIKAADRAVNAVAAMPPLDGDSTMREATLTLMRHYARSFKQDFQPMLPLMLADTLAEKQIAELDSMVSVFAYVEDSLRFLMFSAQANLSAKYGLQMR